MHHASRSASPFCSLVVVMNHKVIPMILRLWDRRLVSFGDECLLLAWGAGVSPARVCVQPANCHLRATLCRLQIGDTAHRGAAVTKGALACGPQDLCRPASLLTKPVRRSLFSTCCGSQSRAPQKRRGPRRFGQILID